MLAALLSGLINLLVLVLILGLIYAIVSGIVYVASLFKCTAPPWFMNAVGGILVLILLVSVLGWLLGALPLLVDHPLHWRAS